MVGFQGTHPTIDEVRAYLNADHQEEMRHSIHQSAADMWIAEQQFKSCLEQALSNHPFANSQPPRREAATSDSTTSSGALFVTSSSSLTASREARSAIPNSSNLPRDRNSGLCSLLNRCRRKISRHLYCS
ncbi:hypothetical protein CLOM_g281 [Closterium sp. NIES-68]|nr:hypothetical protein CLOM_g281 [Closterium sp. NIES-68]GJP76417.1 hypothetical protein CLOP_g6867 [Closterium sp. NIES-67]